MTLKPKEIMAAVEDEPNTHKFRLGVYAFVMIGISTTYQAFFDNLSFRAGIMQNEALAGYREFTDYIDPNSEDVWELRKTNQVLRTKEFKDIKYL